MAETGDDSSSISITDMEENVDVVSSAIGNTAADTKEGPEARRNGMRMLAERKRRNRVKNYFGELRALMPHITEIEKCEKMTVVGHAIDYIHYLEKTKAMLENRKQEQAFAASSSSAPAAMFSAVPVPDCCRDVPTPPPLQQPLTMDVIVPQPLQQQPLAAVVPAPPPQLLMAAAGQVGFQTWSWPNLVLNVSNNSAFINVSTPRHLGMQNMVMVLSVLNNRGIDVVTAQVDSDTACSMLNIYTRVTRTGGDNPSSEEVYKLAVSEILLLLNTN